MAMAAEACCTSQGLTPCLMMTWAAAECATQQCPTQVGNPEIGYVQTRWVFTNPEESYLTKVILIRSCTGLILCQ